MTKPVKKQAPVLVIGDAHFPWASLDVLQAVYDAAAALQPSYIVQIGDLYDEYNFSNYAPSKNLMLPHSELMLGRSGAEEMWAGLHMLAPKARLVQILGNHDDRIYKRLNEAGTGMEKLVRKSIDSLFRFPHVTTHLDSSTEIILPTPAGDVLFMHGFRSKLGDHANYNQMSTVCGHSHLGGCVWKRNRSGPFFELNVGWVGREDSAVFAYGNQKTIRKWTTGFGVIDDLGPRFVPVSA